MEEKTQEKEIRYSKLSLEELKELAEQGDAKAQNSFANLYCYGKDVKKDYKKAVNGTQSQRYKETLWLNSILHPVIIMDVVLKEISKKQWNGTN